MAVRITCTCGMIDAAVPSRSYRTTPTGFAGRLCDRFIKTGQTSDVVQIGRATDHLAGQRSLPWRWQPDTGLCDAKNAYSGQY